MNNTKKMHWQFNLYSAMKDPNLIVYQDKLIVIIKDKYPKSEMHFLMLPHAKIPDIKSLNSHHLPLLKHMDYIACTFFHKYGCNFWCGFHAKPTMVQLHLHVISDDFRGSGLKTAKHWNSYTTSFFISLNDVIADVEKNGRVFIPPPAELEQKLRAPLQCHKCNFRPVNMPSLKVHLLSHTPVGAYE